MVMKMVLAAGIQVTETRVTYIGVDSVDNVFFQLVT